MKREKKPETIAGVIEKRRINLATRQGYVSLLLRLLVLVLAGYLLLTQAFFVTQAKGNGMFPAVKDGDLLLGYRLQTEYAKDDVVRYRVGDATYVGRIVARENDVVTLSDSGTLLVNGTVQAGEILYPSYAKEGIEYPYRVEEGCVFIMGDYRTQTQDSRDFGSIPLDDVEGKVITFLRRRGL